MQQSAAPLSQQQGQFLPLLRVPQPRSPAPFLATPPPPCSSPLWETCGNRTVTVDHNTAVLACTWNSLDAEVEGGASPYTNGKSGYGDIAPAFRPAQQVAHFDLATAKEQADSAAAAAEEGSAAVAVPRTSAKRDDIGIRIFFPSPPRP